MARCPRHRVPTLASDLAHPQMSVRVPVTFVVTLLVISTAVLLFCPTLAVAQLDDLFTPSDTGAGPDWLSLWYVKAGLVLIAFLAALLFCFLLIFQWLLTKSHRWWPKSAYGCCMALVLTVTFGVALALFWNDLAFGRGSGPQSSYQVWGGRGLLIGAWLFLAILMLVGFRSPSARQEANRAKEQDARAHAGV